jgi:hypothetical protein
MRRVAQAAGTVFLLLGVFWAGRESGHGLGAFWEHWWCPIPLALILLRSAAVLMIRRHSPSAGRPCHTDLRVASASRPRIDHLSARLCGGYCLDA